MPAEDFQPRTASSTVTNVDGDHQTHTERVDESRQGVRARPHGGAHDDSCRSGVKGTLERSPTERMPPETCKGIAPASAVQRCTTSPADSPSRAPSRSTMWIIAGRSPRCGP